MELRTKKRIVGFLLLLALGLIIIPLLFGRAITSDELVLSSKVPERPVSPAELSMSIPQSEATIAKVQPAPVPQSRSSSRIVFEQVPATSLGQSTDATKSTTRASTTQVTQKPSTRTTTSQAAAPQKPKIVSATPSNASTLKITNSAGSWVVQAGSFSEKANAEALMQRIQGAGLPAYLTTSKTSKGQLVRVYVGPEILRSAADQMQVKLAQTLNIKGIVVKAKN